MHHRHRRITTHFHYCHTPILALAPSTLHHLLRSLTQQQAFATPLPSSPCLASMERSRSRRLLLVLLLLLVLVSATCASSELPLLPPIHSRSPLVAVSVAASAPNQVELLMIRLIRTFFGDQVKWSPFLRTCEPVEEMHQHHHEHHHRVVREHRHRTSHRLHRKLAIPLT